MRGSLRFGRVAGVEIRAHASWLIVFVLVTWSLAAGYFPEQYPNLGLPTYWLLALISALLLFAAVLIHELSHALVARSRGLPVESITLFVFGGVSNLSEEPRAPGAEAWLAAAGPLASLLVAGVTYALALAVNGISLEAEAVLSYLATVNALLALFNLVPGYPLDGGRVLHAILWRLTGDRARATTIAGGIGQGVAYLFIFWGIWQFFTGNVVGGMWIAFIGWFLASAAQGTVRHVALEQRLAGVTVADIMRQDPVFVEASTSLEDVVHLSFLRHNLRAVPVVRYGRLLGLIALADIGTVPRDRWPYVTAGEVAERQASPATAGPDEAMMTALERMARAHLERLPVLSGGRLVGMLSQSDVARYLQLRLLLGQELPPRDRRAA